MTRQSSEAVPVMTRTETKSKTTKPTARTLSGPYGASFDGEGTKGLTLRAPLDPPGRPSLRRDHLGDADRGHRQRVRQARLRAEGRRGPRLLEPARDQRRRQQVLPRPRRDAGAGDERQAADRPGRQHDRRLGRDPALLRDRRRPEGLPGRADPPHRPPEDGVQLAGLVQRRHREEAAVQCLLHQLGAGHDVEHHGPRQDRGDALQVRLGRGLQPVHDPELPREDDRRRHGERARSAS